MPEAGCDRLKFRLQPKRPEADVRFGADCVYISQSETVIERMQKAKVALRRAYSIGDGMSTILSHFVALNQPPVNKGIL